MGEGTARLGDATTRRAEGTTRAVEIGGSASRVRALGQEIDEVRARLDALVDELDRRRHAALDWRLQLRRHALGLTMSALGLAALAGAGTALRAAGFSATQRRHRSRQG
jgi:hypothetical protein